MKTLVRVAMVALTFLASSKLPSSGQTFKFKSDELRKRYNDQLKSDNGDLIKKCTKTEDEVACSVDDTGFQKSVQAFKQLDLANGKFELKESLILSMSGSKVKVIIISGSREDPMNLFHFVGQLGSLFITLNSELTQDEVTSLLKDKLGIMRGDDDPTIGKPMLEITKTFAATCNNQLSSVSTKIGCVFEPRY